MVFMIQYNFSNVKKFLVDGGYSSKPFANKVKEAMFA